MRWLAALAAAVCAGAQPAPFTIDQVLGFPFPSELTASPRAGKLAWVANTRGVRNIFVAEAPAYQPHPITSYTADDGQEIQQLRWTPDADAVVYVRGGTANPAHNPKGVAEEIWLARLDSAAPTHVGDGHDPAVAPTGDRIAFVSGGQIWWWRPGKNAELAFRSRGSSSRPTWDPQGRRIAFTSQRGDHSLIGLYDTGTQTLRYLDPSTDYDSNPIWSPDGSRIAFLRVPSSGLRPVRQAERASEPWSIRLANPDTGEGWQAWRANAGPGSVFREISAANQILWGDGERLVFPWESDGWTHLYSVPASGGGATLLTPGAFEVEDVALSPGGREVIFSSNQNDIDRRHLWRVPVSGGAIVSLTSGQGIECHPAPTDSAIGFLRSDARHPLHPAIIVSNQARDLEPAAPPGFPVEHMIAPQQVIFPSEGGLSIHGQLFLPPSRTAQRSPAVVFFHGGPRRQMLLGWHCMYYYSNAYALNQYLANSGYIVLSVNFRSGIGYGLDFREALHYGASGGSDYFDVQAAAAYLKSRADVDPAHIGAWGGSYGGYLTAMALARSSDVFRAGVDFHGVHNWATELGIPPTEPDYKVAFDSSPLAFVDTWRSPVLLIHGDDDPDVQFNQTVRLADALRRRKIEVDELIFPDEVHDFLLYRSWRTAYEAAAAFLKRKL